MQQNPLPQHQQIGRGRGFQFARTTNRRGRYVHKIRPIIKHFITQRDLPVSERLKHVRMNWEKLTSDPFILNLVQGYQIPFSSKPV